MEIWASTSQRRHTALVGVVAVGLLALLYPIVVLLSGREGTYYLHVTILVLLYAGTAVGLNLPIKMGYLPVGQAAFMAIGAYTSALATRSLGVPIPVGFVLASLSAGLVALAFGRVVLRLRGTYFVLGTFAFGEVVRLIAVSQQSVLGGAEGISGLPTLTYAPGILAFTPRQTREILFYYCALLLVVVACTVVWVTYRSSVGHILDALRMDLRLAESQGLNTVAFRLYAFVVSAMLAGPAGAMLVHYLAFVNPQMFTSVASVNLLMMNVIGGSSSMLGPLVGALLIAPLPEVLRGADAVVAQILYGGLIVAVMLAWPTGIVGALQAVLHRARWRRASRPGEPRLTGETVAGESATPGS